MSAQQLIGIIRRHLINYINLFLTTKLYVSMDAAQGTIPFKSRKRTHLRSKTEGSIENQDILNMKELKVVLKRHITDDVDIYSDSCSDIKIKKKKIVSPNTVLKDIPAEEIKETKPLIGREKEIEWLETFLVEQLEKEESASVYISGQPGTGKTASLLYVMQLPKIKKGYKQVYVNCTSVKSASSIYMRICKELNLRPLGASEKACCAAIEKYLYTDHQMLLVVLDEMDQLASRRQAVLYAVLEWARAPRLVVAGAANALDLPQRCLPRLQARAALRPRTLHFPPYERDQIIRIFRAELAAHDRSHLFSPVALHMLAAKIASVSGDVRRALDIGRRVIELAKRNKFNENQSVDSLMKDSSVTVELKQVLQVLNDVYGGSRNIEAEIEDSFPMQQKLILGTMLLMITKGKIKDITMGKLHDVYKKVCAARHVSALGAGELAGAVALLEARGAVRGARGEGTRGRRVALAWDPAELAAALRDKPLLSSILEDTHCLPARR